MGKLFWTSVISYQLSVIGYWLIGDGYLEGRCPERPCVQRGV